MATPAKSVQCRDVETVVEMYNRMGIPAFAIRQNGVQPFKYTGDSMEQGAAELRWIADTLQKSESAAIYTVALFEDPAKGIKEKTEADASFNFRFSDEPTSYLPAEAYRGAYGQLLQEMQGLKKTIAGMQEKEPESKLGVVGELMEVEAMQPILMAIGTRIADLITGEGKVGELARVSGIPGVSPVDSGTIPAGSVPWRMDPVMLDALDRLSARVPDLAQLLSKLADTAERSPVKFNLYLVMLRKTG